MSYIEEKMYRPSLFEPAVGKMSGTSRDTDKVIPSVRPSVSLFVCNILRCCTKTVKHIVEILSLLDSSIHSMVLAQLITACYEIRTGLK